MTELAWQDPIVTALNIDQQYHEDWVFLYSSMIVKDLSCYSIIALDPIASIENLAEFKDLLARNSSDFWFGYIGYEYKHQIETLELAKHEIVQFQQVLFKRFGTIYIFDHLKRKITLHGKHSKIFTNIQPATIQQNVNIRSLFSNMDTQEYLDKVNTIKQRIVEGDLYQANLTRKFFGHINYSSSLDLFLRLCKLSPSPYSAYIKFGKLTILSSSPEQFLAVDENRIVNTTPIKGTITRSDNSKQDHINRQKLLNSNKDISENLMIVDLLRNDFSKFAELNTVKASSLFDITAYSNLYHMSSNISCRYRQDIDLVDILNMSFPPGSMTGTPKIKAMNLCTQLENYTRGIYSGVLGWLNTNGTLNLSVIIRTLILRDDYFEFQVGGAITHDSEPLSELEETVTKAKSICKLLKITQAQLLDAELG